ncbi:MAG: hypothetical protein CFE28_01405 [Alphaproteobacteria bacterium PA2]|nr:MAG: hypothetical protein CFE28_01405 [Alphaproteobacteria bacterium PA2]
MRVTPEACRAGRAILKWSMRDLAEHSGVAWTTINRLEAGTEARATTAEKIVAAFESHGVEVSTDADKTGAVLVYAKRVA